MANAKKYILTGVILGSISALAAGLIALTNFVTEKKIIQNELNKLNSGIKEIFGDDSSVSLETKVEGYQYTTTYYTVNNSNNEFLGYAFKSEGSNMYGKISLISGFSASSRAFMSLYLINNEQTYASTLKEKYIEPLNANEKGLEDVSCGATYGAKLVRDMVSEANEVAITLWK